MLLRPKSGCISSSLPLITDTCHGPTPIYDLRNEWGEAFPNKLLGAATIDRLRHGAYKIVLDGTSFRSPKDNPDNSKIKPLKHSKSSIAKGGEKS